METKQETKYTTDGKCEVRRGKIIIARSYVGRGGYEVRILQGVDRIKAMNRIAIECPEFLRANGISENYYPKTFVK